MRRRPSAAPTRAQAETALLQYTSGSTRDAGCRRGDAQEHRREPRADQGRLFRGHRGRFHRRTLTLVSWLPFYHDMGLILGIFAPVVVGVRAVLTSPMAFLQKPARWMQISWPATPRPFSAAPNFAFELAVRRTSDDDMAGLDLGNVLTSSPVPNGYMPRRYRRFTERFARFNFPDRPCGRRMAWPRRRCTRRRHSLGARCRSSLRLREAVGRPCEALRRVKPVSS